MLHLHRRIPLGRGVGLACAALSLVALIAASTAFAADTVRPVVGVATLTPSVADGNNNWRFGPATLNLSATDDVAVTKFQYSLDGGVTYIDVPVTPGPSVNATVLITQQGNTTVRYRAVDSSGNESLGVSVTTTLSQPSAVGATGVRLQSTTGRAAGDVLVIDTGANQETATIASVPTPAPPSPNPNVLLTAPLTIAHAAGTTVSATPPYRTIAVLIDSFAPLPNWATLATTLQSAAAVPGATEIRLASTTGRAAGEVLVVDQGANAETVTIASIVTPAPAAPAANVVLANALTKTHLTGAGVYVPAIVGGTILQSRTLSPFVLTDPRRRDATDTVSNGAGGSAIRRMTVDGEFVIPKVLQLNRLTVGRHVQTVAPQDAAGNVAKYTNTFVITTSFADLAAVIDQYATNGLRTTLNGAQAVGATGLRLATPFGFRAGQTLVVDTGDNQETVTIATAPTPPPTVNTTLSAAATAGATEVRLANYTTATTGGPNAPTVNGPVAGQPIVLDTGANQELISVKSHIVPLPAAPAPNVILNAPLTKDHAAGTATSLVNVILSAPLTKAHASGAAVVNPRPFISADTAAALKALLTQAQDAVAGGKPKVAAEALHLFKETVNEQVKAETVEEGEKAEKAEARASRDALVSAAEALLDELKGRTVDTAGTGVTVGPADPGDQALRVFWNPTSFVANPLATYKVLVNGRSGGFRHQSIVDMEAMFQKLGAENGFDVDIWDPNINQGPGRQAPEGVSLTTNPFLDPATLSQYKTIVFDSTVGLNAAGLNFTEFTNLQAYIRAGGGFVAIHGAIDSMQNVPWYMDLAGAGFTNHGGNSAGILIDTESGGHVELVNADRGSAATSAIPDRFFTVEELYNTNRDPVALGIVHPLVYENEDTLVGQLGYSVGALHNSDKHAMVWCRNFDGGRSFSSTLGHSWQFASEAWYQQMMLAAVEWTAGVGDLNCVTYAEVADLLAAALAAGDISSDEAAVLSGLLADAKAAFDLDDYEQAKEELEKFVEQTKTLHADQLTLKGKELIDWAKGIE